MELLEGDNVKEKLNHFGIDIKLECSFLDGQVQISGAAKYVQDHQVSQYQ